MFNPWRSEPFRRTRQSFRTRLALAIGILTCVLALVISVSVGRTLRRQQEADRGQMLAEVAYQMSDKLDRGMFERYRDLQILSTLSAMRNPAAVPADQRVLLEKLQSTYPDYAWIGLTDQQGVVQASTGQLLEQQNVAQRPWFSNGLHAPYVGDVHEAVKLAKLLPQADGEPLRFVDVAVPIVDLNGQLRGVLGSHLSWRWASEVEDSLLQPMQDRQQVEIVILNQQNNVLLGPKPLQDQQLALPWLAPAMQQGYAVATWPDGTSYLTGVARSTGYRSYPGLGWTVLVRQPASAAFAPARVLEWQIILGGVGAGVLFGVLGWFIAGHLARPMLAIAHAADQISHGNRAITLPVYSGDDEITLLSQSLNTLVHTLTAQEQALLATNERLRDELHERERAAEERMRLYNAAQDAIRARDEFLSIAAHELKTPITNLMGFAQVIQRQVERGQALDPGRVGQAMQVIDQQSVKLSRLVGQLLDVARIESGRLEIERESVNLSALVDGLVATAQVAAPQHTISIRGGETFSACVDPLRLDQVITNLLDNAIKYSPGGGAIELAITQPDVQHVAIAVRDHGIGIPPEHRARIFDRLFQAHSYYGGMGLGLYISRQIVEAHAGTLAAHFPPDGGTHMIVTLPLDHITIAQEQST